MRLNPDQIKVSYKKAQELIDKRPPGFWEWLMEHDLCKDKKDIVLTRKDYAEYKLKFNPELLQKKTIEGLGDVVGKVATPIAVALKKDCVDIPLEKLKPDSPCAKRKAALNAAVPFKQPL